MLLDGEFCNFSEFRKLKILIRNLKEKTFCETKLRRYRIKIGPYILVLFVGSSGRVAGLSTFHFQ
jgi:hypothetical protein